jgi:membrane protease subunit HflK
MLTEDENIVDVQLSIQYQIKDPRNYLFAVQDPDATLRQVIESALREVVGKSTMDFVLTEGRADIVAEVKDLSQTILDQYQTGLIITNVNLQDAQPPDEVQEAFADAIKAREDEQRVINEAEAYRNEVLPRARGEAARQLQEADAYKEQVIAQAEGEARRFEQLLTEYAKAPEVTRERLYLETLETVMTNTSKVLIDAEGGNNLIYLPLDRLMNRTGERSTGRDNLNGPSLARDLPVPQRSDSSSTRLRDTNRSRETR